MRSRSAAVRQAVLALGVLGLLVGLLALGGLGAAQQTTWTRTFDKGDRDYGYSVQQTSDGGYIIVGWTQSYSTGRYDVWLIKTDRWGNKKWDRTFGGEGPDEGWSVQQTSDGGYIIAGYIWSRGAGDVWLIKTDSRGNVEWDRTFGGGYWWDVGFSVQQTRDGGYIIAGATCPSSARGDDVLLIKTDPQGNKLWDRTFGRRSDDRGFSVQQTSDGGYIIVGYTYLYPSVTPDLWLIKTDFQGYVEWDRTFGGERRDEGYSVQQTSDGGYIIVGYTDSYGAGDEDVWLIKTDSRGNVEWDRTFGGSSYEGDHSVQQTRDGGYIITGSRGGDVLLIKTDPQGHEEWDRTFGGGNWNKGYSVQQTEDGGYIIVGITARGAYDTDVLLIKTDSQGNVQE